MSASKTLMLWNFSTRGGDGSASPGCAECIGAKLSVHAQVLLSMALEERAWDGPSRHITRRIKAAELFRVCKAHSGACQTEGDDDANKPLRVPY